MTLKFIALPRVYQDQPVYGAAKGAFTFVVTEDPDGFSASVKIKGATPFDGTRHDLGGYAAHKTFVAAQKACEDFYRNRNA